MRTINANYPNAISDILMNRYLNLFFLFLIAFILGTHNLRATDRSFAFVYESRTLQGGLRDLEVWTTYKYGREDFFSAVENRIEFEVGLGKKLQTSFYLNLGASTVPFTTYIPITTTTGETIFEPQTDLKTKFDIGFSNEWKYQLTDPITNTIGSALYCEVTIFSNEFELEGKVILDKNIDRFLTAFNLVGELEWEAKEQNSKTVWKRETKLEADYGLSYAITKSFNIGLEARSNNVFSHDEGFEHSALYIGPNISYRQENWWLSFAALPQIIDLKNGGRTLEDDEKLNARLVFAYSF
ncbi:MAG: hypothetical protein H0W62_10715 [Chitinophagales bacterium]|nr:hypothetical protein [Chitinophagales bacterium]